MTGDSTILGAEGADDFHSILFFKIVSEIGKKCPICPCPVFPGLKPFFHLPPSAPICPLQQLAAGEEKDKKNKFYRGVSVGRKAKRKQAMQAAKKAVLVGISLSAMPCNGGLVLPAVVLDVEVAERARALLNAAGYSDAQVVVFVMGLLEQKRRLVEKAFDD